MSIQTHVLENNEWVSRMVTADELMRTNASSTRKTGRRSLSKAPTCGLLTRTIVESPVIRWVLPVQLRSSRYNDVALIGDHCVQICELGRDRQLQHVVKKKDFGSRIRNAVVMGSPQYFRKASESTEDAHIKTEDGDTEIPDMGTTMPGVRGVNSLLPPQLLVLVLERGDLVFLFLQQGPARSWVFVSSTHSIPGERLVYPGFHLAIDPSSNFLAVGCSENLFIVYQLESMEALRKQYFLKEPLKPIQRMVSRSVRGIIHKIEFLHPTHGNEVQVILMVILVQPDVSRLAIYEWDSRHELGDIFLGERTGYRLDQDYRMPLMVVPLKVRNAFLIITENITATCSDILGGPPVFVQFELANRDDTELHHGTHEPLWTAWTRPIRHPPYHDKNDIIYLAREDGLINFLEYGDELDIETSVSMGSVDCNIDTAFACLFHLFGDVLVTGGDSGPGAVWNVEARQSPQRIGSIPNWSPTVDFAVTESSTDESRGDEDAPDAIIPYQSNKIFACSGRGITGAITEFRYGIQARIGLDLTYSSNIKQCWAIPDFDETAEDGFFLLLALPNASAVLRLSRDLSEVSEKDDDATPYDLSSTTLAVQETPGVVIQVTESSITIVTPTSRSRNLTSDVLRDHTATVADAAVKDSTIALAVYSGPNFKIVLLGIMGLEVSVQRVFDVEGEVTCLAIEQLAESLVILAGLQKGQASTLAIYPTGLDQQDSTVPVLLKLLPDTPSADRSTGSYMGNTPFGALTSVLYLGEQSGKASILAGTRNGDILTIQVKLSHPVSHESYRIGFGTSPCHVFPGGTVGESKSVLAYSDTELAMMSGHGTGDQGGYFEDIFRIWPTDGDRPNMPRPLINALAPLHEQLPEYGESTIVMVAGPRIMITELQLRPKPVPRYFPVHGTPVKIIYSKRLEAIVTIVSKNGVPSLHFLDPTTGTDISQPLERKKQNDSYTYYEVDYITGLGNPDTRAMSLTTWTYRSGAIRGDWIVLAMRRKDNEGLLLIISAEPEIVPTQTYAPRRIRFWTKFDRKIRDGPIWSVATDEQGIFLCVGQIVQYNTIESGKFRVVSQFELPSPASWMQVVQQQLHVVTTNHSLIILDYKTGESDTAMTVLWSDDICRVGLHSTKMGSPLSKITLLSDPMCGIHGLWTPQEHDRPYSIVFQAELKASIRRFAHGATRALWNTRGKKARYGFIPSSVPGSDVIGLTLDGSLQQLSLLNEDAWRFLRFIQNLAMAFPTVCPHTSFRSDDGDTDPEPESFPRRNMHVDGDILQRCFEKRVLEELISEPRHLQRFQELLKPLDEDRLLPSSQDYSQDGLSDDAPYYELAYRILKYYLTCIL
ncbi:hypothetical protein M426DRAFT_15804 [Hypoxylon sp. CI-4A]|nr:hypothetical protein M426DRAFT_15804 [Hypoxylon sp. CI-4A]